MIDDLSDISTEDLITELLDRHHHAGFIGGNYDEHEANIIRRRWKGNPHMVAGLLHDLQEAVIADHRRNARPI
jgi:5'-deoxynucleotidase YfbR-like HD superfamily hydrolase